MVQISQLYVTTRKTIALTIWTFVGKVMSLLFNTLSRLVIAFLPRSKHLISWLVTTMVILEHKKRKSVTLSTFSSSTCHEVMGPDIILDFLFFSLKRLFQFLPSPSSRSSLVPLHFLLLEWYHSHIWDCWCFSHLSWFYRVTNPAQHLSWCAQYRLNKQGDSTQPCQTPFSILNKTVVPSLSFSSATQSCLILCDPMDYSTQGFPVPH